MILVIGAIHCKHVDLMNTANKMGLSVNDLEIISDYKKLKNYDWGSLKNSTRYSDVIIGCIEHSAGKSGSRYSGVIQKMQNEPGYPNIIKASRTMKLTISSFKKAILSSNWYKSQQNDLTKVTNSDII